MEGTEDIGQKCGPDEFLLPIIPLQRVKLPTEVVPLHIFEPRYRLMFKLVNHSSKRLFGIAYAYKEVGTMDSIGILCELTHFVPIPERMRLLVIGRALSRFSVQRLVHDKPFVAAIVVKSEDDAPEGIA